MNQTSYNGLFGPHSVIQQDSEETLVLLSCNEKQNEGTQSGGVRLLYGS